MPDTTYPPFWGWYTGTGGDGSASQDFFGSRSSIPFDLAFTLIGANGPGDPSAPEPSAYALLVGMFAGGAVAIRRRARR